MPARIFALSVALASAIGAQAAQSAADDAHRHEHQVQFTVQSVKDGRWSDARTWKPARVPTAGDRVLVSRNTSVEYDVKQPAVIRLLQVVGTLSFARDRDTELNVGILKVQNSDTCSESGFACDFRSVNKSGEPNAAPGGMPALLVGTLENPIPTEHTARIRLHFLEGMDPNHAPAIACCSARMEIHGSPLSRTWVKLGADAKLGDDSVNLSEAVSGWRVGDEVIVTASNRAEGAGSFRNGAKRERQPQTERRTITVIDATTLTLDSPLKFEHAGSGEFLSEIANLSRNVIVESADPSGVRGHTVYHRFSRGGISYARFAHLGKEGILGRYSIHYHLVGDTMRGSSVQGVAIVDSHNRWITIHGTQYLVVRDCVGYRSVGHGYFMEDGTEVYNLLDRNLAVHAVSGRPLPDQVLPFDPNDGAGFWWANGRNTLTRNVSTENDEYGYRYDMQKRSNFDPHLPILQPNGEKTVVDVRTIPIWRFEDNEARAEGFYGMVVAANGNDQPDTPIRDERMLQHIKNVDWTGPDARHPHVIRGLTISGAHYGFRPHSPSMLMENVRIDRVAYGVYRPALDNHVYRNLHLSRAGSEPFNRGMDDASAQAGSFTVDGLTLESFGNNSQVHPIVHMSDNNLSGRAESHFRNVVLKDCDPRRAVFNRGGSTRVDPFVEEGVPYFIHDHFGPGRTAKIVSVKAKHLIDDGHQYVAAAPLTGDESRIAEVEHVEWPTLLDPVDDLPPATVITSVRRENNQLVVRGLSHDNGEIVSVKVNDQTAQLLSSSAGVVDWQVTLTAPPEGCVVALAQDKAGNVEQAGHRLVCVSE